MLQLFKDWKQDRRLKQLQKRKARKVKAILKLTFADEEERDRAISNLENDFTAAVEQFSRL